MARPQLGWKFKVVARRHPVILPGESRKKSCEKFDFAEDSLDGQLFIIQARKR